MRRCVTFFYSLDQRADQGMTPTGLLLVLLLLQVVVAAAIWYDATSRRLEWGVGYSYVTTLPLIGYFFVPVYLSRRNTEPQYDRPEMDVQQPDTGMAWRLELPDPWGMPRRFALTIIAVWRRYWLYGILVLTLALFVTAVTVDARVNQAALAVCGAHWLFIWGGANGYRDAAFSLDVDDGTLTHEYVSGFILEGSETEVSVNVEKIDRVKMVPVGSHAVVRLGYEDWLKMNGPLAVVIHRTRTQELLDHFDRAGIRTEISGPRVAAVRLFGALGVLAVSPVVVTAQTGEIGGDLLLIFLLVLIAWVLKQVVSTVRRVVTTGTGAG